MIEFLGSIAMFWGFILLVIGTFCLTNIKIAGKVIQKSYKKILLISIGTSLIIFLSVFVDFMPSIMEMFALAIVSSCWLIDLLNKERFKCDVNYNYMKFYVYDVLWIVSMLVTFCWYIGYTFTNNFSFVLIMLKIITVLLVIVASSIGSQKMLTKTF